MGDYSKYNILIPANLGQYEIVGNISVLRSYVTI